MANKRVIAYYMHEEERNAAINTLSQHNETESFAIGDIDENAIDQLRREGVIVQEITPQTESPLALEEERQSVAYLGTETGAIDITLDFGSMYYLTLAGPLLEEWQSVLQQLEVDFRVALPDYCWIVRIPSEQVADVHALAFVTSLKLRGSDRNLPKRQQMVSVNTIGMVREVIPYDILLDKDTPLDDFILWLRERNIMIAAAEGTKVRVFLMDDDSRMVDISKNADWVIDIQPYIPPSLHNDRSRLQLGIDVENPINSINYQGEDEIIAVADTGLDDQHPDLLNKVVGLVGLGRNGDTSDTHGHGTHVAGSILGDGSASKGLFKGVAPQAKLYFQSLLDAKGELGGLPFQLETLFAQAYDAGARIHNNSWGSNTFSSYRVNSMEVDQYVNKQKDMLIVISAGNAGTAADPLIGRRQTQQGYVNWLSVNAPATAKNGLTVGASRSDRSEGGLSQRTYGSAWPEKFPTPPTSTEKISEDPTSIAAFSSRGPCDDYRIKPDVVAPGTDILSCRSSIAPLKNFWGLHANTGYAFMGGTSMSAPLVSGCAAIVRQYYRTQRHHLPSAALLKATLINSTQWLKGDSAVADYSTAPNYHQGFGCVNVQTAIPNDLNPELQLYFYDNWQSPGQHFAGTGQRKRFSFTLNSGGELRITMAYTDLPGRALQNNLNLFLELPDRTKTYGNIDLPHGLNQPDTTNNVETIRIRDAQAGRYLIQITASNLLQSQDFALVVTGNFETPMIEV